VGGNAKLSHWGMPKLSKGQAKRKIFLRPRSQQHLSPIILMIHCFCLLSIFFLIKICIAYLIL
jgi:hypothetical protein